MNVSAIQVDTNWNLKGDNFQNETVFLMKPCTIEDFGGDDVAAGYYYSWNGFTILCPELVNKDGKTLTLNGAWGFNETSKIEFRVNRC